MTLYTLPHDHPAYADPILARAAARYLSLPCLTEAELPDVVRNNPILRSALIALEGVGGDGTRWMLFPDFQFEPNPEATDTSSTANSRRLRDLVVRFNVRLCANRDPLGVLGWWLNDRTSINERPMGDNEPLDDDGKPLYGLRAPVRLVLEDGQYAEERLERLIKEQGSESYS